MSRMHHLRFLIIILLLIQARKDPLLLPIVQRLTRKPWNLHPLLIVWEQAQTSSV